MRNMLLAVIPLMMVFGVGVGTSEAARSKVSKASKSKAQIRKNKLSKGSEAPVVFRKAGTKNWLRTKIGKAAIDFSVRTDAKPSSVVGQLLVQAKTLNKPVQAMVDSVLMTASPSDTKSAIQKRFFKAKAFRKKYPRVTRLQRHEKIRGVKYGKGRAQYSIVGGASLEPAVAILIRESQALNMPIDVIMSGTLMTIRGSDRSNRVMRRWEVKSELRYQAWKAKQAAQGL